MFLIAGIYPKHTSLGRGNGVCLACGKSVDFHLSKQCSVFSLFFIPLIPFGVSYHANCPNCCSIMELSKEKGKDFERGINSTIYDADMRIVQNNAGPACASCGARIIVNQNFCYHCGAKI